MAPQEQTLEELATYWERQKTEAEEALKHVRALMRLATATKRKVEPRPTMKGRKKPKYKKTGEDFILDILVKAAKPLTSQQIREELGTLTKKKWSRQGVNFALLKLLKEERISRKEAPEGSASQHIYSVHTLA